MEIVAFIISIFALVISGIALYYTYFVGPDIKLIFNKKDRNAVFDLSSGGLAEFEGVFINRGNRDGYIHGTNFKRSGLVVNSENKNILCIPNFVIVVNPQAPLGITLNPKEIRTPFLIEKGGVFSITIYIHRQGCSALEDDEENQKWFKNHSNWKLKIKFYYTTTDKNGLKTKHETLNLII
ncbi:MAG: hypothetical protein AAB019_04480 [Planctomycetota bacterium]